MAIDAKAQICNLALGRVQVGKRLQNLATDAFDDAGKCRDAYDQCRDELLARFRWPFAEAQAQLSRLGSATYSAAVTYAVGDSVSFGSMDGSSGVVGVPNLGGPLGGAIGYGARVYRSLQAGNLNHPPDTSGTFWRRLSRDGWPFVFTWPADCLVPREIYSGARLPRDFETYPHAFVYDADLGKLLLCHDDTPDLRYTARVDNPVLYPPGFISALAWRLAGELAGSVKGDAKLAADIMRPRIGSYDVAACSAFSESRSMEESGPQPESMFITVRG